MKVCVPPDDLRSSSFLSPFSTSSKDLLICFLAMARLLRLPSGMTRACVASEGFSCAPERELRRKSAMLDELSAISGPYIP